MVFRWWTIDGGVLGFVVAPVFDSLLATAIAILIASRSIVWMPRAFVEFVPPSDLDLGPRPRLLRVQTTFLVFLEYNPREKLSKNLLCRNSSVTLPFSS